MTTQTAMVPWLAFLQTGGADYPGHVSGWSHPGACCWGPLWDTHHPFHTGVLRPSLRYSPSLPYRCVEALSEILTIPSIQVCWGPLWDTISSIQVCWGPLLDTISSVQVLRPSQIYSLSLSYRYVGVPSEIIIIPSIQVCWGLLLHGHHLFQVCWGPLLHQGQIWCRLKKKKGPVGETINWGPPFLYTCKKITCLH